MISLENLLTKFRRYKNYEFEGALRMTHVPSRGSGAYLNTIFEAADDVVQREIIDPLKLPSQVRSFYRKYNGAHLFLDSLSVFGFFPKVYQLDRLRKSYPYNIIAINREFFDDSSTSDIILVGSYGFDRSEVFVEKATGTVSCSVADDLSSIRATWPSFESWLEEEIARFCEFFDESGNQLVELEDTLPGRAWPM